MKIKSWNDIKNLLITILVVLVIAGMLTDFISWKTAINIIKEQMPTESQIHLYNGGGGADYIPLRWRGELVGEVWLFSDKDLNIKNRKIVWDYNGNIVESVGRIWVHMPNSTMIDSYPTEDLEIHTTFWTSEKKYPLIPLSSTIIRKEHTFDAWLYILDKGTSNVDKYGFVINRKNATIGIIYKVDDTTYVQVHKNAWWRNCKGGGYVWSFWKE